MSARRFLAVLAVLLAGALAFAGPASASPYGGHGNTTVTVGDTAVSAGDAVVFSGTGFAAGCELTITVNGRTVGTVNADDSGAFATSVTLTTPGANTLIARGCGESNRATVFVTAAGNAAVPGTGGLPHTGFQSPVALLGAGLVLLGTMLVGVTANRRRRSLV